MKSSRSRTQPRTEAQRHELALVEWTRISREIEALEHAERTDSEQGMLTALRMCRVYLERQLERRGWRRRSGRWEQPIPSS